MQIPITDFKAKCTEYIKPLAKTGPAIEITSQGKIVAVVSPSPRKKRKNPFFGSLKETVTLISEDFDIPMGDDEWEI